MYIKEQV